MRGGGNWETLYWETGLGVIQMFVCRAGSGVGAVGDVCAKVLAHGSSGSPIKYKCPRVCGKHSLL